MQLRGICNVGFLIDLSEYSKTAEHFFVHSLFLLVCNISLQGLAETWDSVHPGN